MDCTARYTARSPNATPISRNARRCRACPVPDSSHTTTTEAPISISESSPNPASATDRAATAVMASTTMPTAFHPSVRYSNQNPYRNSRRRVVSCVDVTPAVWQPAFTGTGPTPGGLRKASPGEPTGSAGSWDSID